MHGGSAVTPATPPVTRCSSLWHMPLAASFTSTSPAFGGSSSISSTLQGVCRSQRIAAIVFTVEPPSRVLSRLTIASQLQLRRRRRVANEVQHLHRTGHGDVQQPRPQGGSVEDLMRVDDHDAIELESLHGFRGEHRYVVMAEVVHT